MHIIEKFEGDPVHHEYKIFVDLDGVMVDFNKFAKDCIGIRPTDWELDKGIKRDFWKAVGKWVKDGKKFFEDMEPMADANILWGHIKKYHPTILSATGFVNNAKVEKRAWVTKHLGSTAGGMALLVRSASDKAQYAAPNHILIDDREKAIDPWVAAGGIGILHTSALETIKQLKKLGL